jgi:hypothetical protein
MEHKRRLGWLARRFSKAARLALATAIMLSAIGLGSGTAAADFSLVSLAGQVNDVNGTPVQNVTATATNVATNATYGPDTTDGSFSLLVPVGTYDVTLTAPGGSGLAPITQRYTVHGQFASQFYDVQMASSYHHFSGFFSDTQANPLGNVDIALTYIAPNNEFTRNVRHITTTDASGHYDIMAPPHPYAIEIDTLGRTNNPLRIRLGSNASDANGDIDMTTSSVTQNLTLPMATVTVPVVNSAGLPVPNFPVGIQSQGLNEVTLWPGGPTYQAASQYTSTTETDFLSPDYGKAKLRVITGPAYEVCGGTRHNAGRSASSSNTTTRFCIPDWFAVSGDSQHTLSTATQTISGTLKDSRGQAIAGASVFALPELVEFGELGVITGPGGEYSITTQPQPQRLYTFKEPNTDDLPQYFSLQSDLPVVDLTNGSVTRDLTLALAVVTVRVEDPSGTSMPGLTVVGESPGRVGAATLWDGGPEFVGGARDTDTTSDPAGEATLNLVQGYGYDLCAEYQGSRFCVPGQPVLTADTAFVIQLSEQTPPVLQPVTWSSNPLPQGQTTTLSAVATDDTAVSKVEYTLNNGARQLMAFNQTAGVWQATFGANLVPDTYSVAVIATDAGGNESAAESDILAVYNNANGHVSGRAKVLPAPGDQLPIAVDTSSNPAELLVGFTSNQAGTTSVEVEYTIKNKKNEFSITSSAIKWTVIPDNTHASVMVTGDLETYVNGVRTVVQNVSVQIDVTMDTGGNTGSLTMRAWEPGANPSVAVPIYSVTDAALLANSTVKIKK